MRRFKNILFLFEEAIAPGPAFERAVELARRNDAKLTLAHAIESVPVDDLAGVPAAGDAWAALHVARETELAALADKVRARGVDIRTVVLTGIPFRDVIEHVVRHGNDLVVKAARVVGPRALLFGSTDMHLMRKCPCPVWIDQVRAESGGYGRIMAAVDVGDQSASGRSMTRLVLDLATSMGAQEGSDVHVVHAWTSIGERMATAARRGLLPADEIEREVREEDQRRQALFRDAVAPYVMLSSNLHLHLLQGDPREVLPVFARDREMDLIVMGTVARTGIPGVFMGNTAEDVLRQVEGSVLTLKPEGFVSPVS